MRIFKTLFIALLAITTIAVAKENKLGIREVSHIRFETQVRVGTIVLPAGEYLVRHTMQGEDHIMIFKRDRGGDEIKVKCMLVALPKNAPQTQAIYQVGASNERTLQELVFQGDSAKHVF